MDDIIFPLSYSLSSCRICLGENATIPIFDDDNMSVLSIFNSSFNEKLQQVPGLPDLLCPLCYSTIKNVASFFEKFRATQQILQNSLKIVKQEYIDEDDFNFSEPDSLANSIFLDCNNLTEDTFIKKEPKCKDVNTFINSNILIENNNIKRKSTAKTKSHISKKDAKIKEEFDIEELFKDRPDLTIVKTEKKDKLIKSSRVASSLLEGLFQWNGEKWCVSKKGTKKLQAKPVHVKKIADIKKPKTLDKPTTKTYLCDICGSEFHKSERLRRHKLRHEGPVSCSICKKQLRNQVACDEHILHVHKSEKVVCSICGAILKNKKTLTGHIQIMHEGKKKKKQARLPCNLCEKSFVAKKFLIMHIRSVHTGERPEVCIFCGKTFTHADYLKEHMRLHTGETPYNCPVCGRGYAQRGNMKSHIVHNHRLSQIDPELLLQIKPCYTRLMKP